MMRTTTVTLWVRFQVDLDGRLHSFRPIVGTDGPSFDTVVAALELIRAQQWQHTLATALAAMEVELAASRDRALEPPPTGNAVYATRRSTRPRWPAPIPS